VFWIDPEDRPQTRAGRVAVGRRPASPYRGGRMCSR
jgi:hypothetical protein